MTLKESKKTEAERWKEIRDNLNELTLQERYNHSGLWDQAVDLFSERLKNFFFTPIERLSKYQTGEGFSIVALQCALIETFAAFKYGKIYNDNLQEEVTNGMYYKKTGKIFIDFLENEELLKDFFVCKPHSALRFYKDVRCGLLHETRTKKNWIIKADAIEYGKKYDSENKASYNEFTLIKHHNAKFIIFRDQFKSTLVKYFTNYKSDLKKPCKNFNNLRRLFARKLDHLFLNDKEIEIAKSNFEWWEEDNEEQSSFLSFLSSIQKECENLCRNIFQKL
jgi:hypothetical protein